jgi:ribosomal protein S18 acetylase RimI-like enzyme
VIRLLPMDKVTYDRWLEATVRDYAEEKVASGNWPAAGALERSTAEFEGLLPDGPATANHELRAMVDDAGERVGYAWFAQEDKPFGRVVFIYDIEVDPAHRRKGHAQAALAEIETFARASGCVGVQLHVFGANEGARQLYRRTGFVETNVIMLKRVDSIE